MSAYNSDNANFTPDTSQLLKQLERLSGCPSSTCGRMLQSSILLRFNLQISIALRNTSFTPQEQQIILMTIDHEVDKDYSSINLAKEAEICQLPAFISESIKSDKPIESEKLQALRQFTSQVFTLQGRVNQRMMNEYLAAGYNRASVQDLFTVIGQKGLGRFTGHKAKILIAASRNCISWQHSKPACLAVKYN